MIKCDGIVSKLDSTDLLNNKKTCFFMSEGFVLKIKNIIAMSILKDERCKKSLFADVSSGSLLISDAIFAIENVLCLKDGVMGLKQFLLNRFEIDFHDKLIVKISDLILKELSKGHIEENAPNLIVNSCECLNILALVFGELKSKGVLIFLDQNFIESNSLVLFEYGPDSVGFSSAADRALYEKIVFSENSIFFQKEKTLRLQNKNNKLGSELCERSVFADLVAEVLEGKYLNMFLSMLNMLLCIGRPSIQMVLDIYLSCISQKDFAFIIEQLRTNSSLKLAKSGPSFSRKISCLSEIKSCLSEDGFKFVMTLDSLLNISSVDELTLWERSFKNWFVKKYGDIEQASLDIVKESMACIIGSKHLAPIGFVRQIQILFETLFVMSSVFKIERVFANSCGQNLGPIGNSEAWQNNKGKIDLTQTGNLEREAGRNCQEYGSWKNVVVGQILYIPDEIEKSNLVLYLNEICLKTNLATFKQHFQKLSLLRILSQAFSIENPKPIASWSLVLNMDALFFDVSKTLSRIFKDIDNVVPAIDVDGGSFEKPLSGAKNLPEGQNYEIKSQYKMCNTDDANVIVDNKLRSLSVSDFGLIAVSPAFFGLKQVHNIVGQKLFEVNEYKNNRAYIKDVVRGHFKHIPDFFLDNKFLLKILDNLSVFDNKLIIDFLLLVEQEIKALGCVVLEDSLFGKIQLEYGGFEIVGVPDRVLFLEEDVLILNYQKPRNNLHIASEIEKWNNPKLLIYGWMLQLIHPTKKIHLWNLKNDKKGPSIDKYTISKEDMGIIDEKIRKSIKDISGCIFLSIDNYDSKANDLDSKKYDAYLHILTLDEL